MELTTFLTSEWRRRSVLSVIRKAVTVSEAASALGQNLKLSAYAQDIYNVQK